MSAPGYVYHPVEEEGYYSGDFADITNVEYMSSAEQGYAGDGYNEGGYYTAEEQGGGEWQLEDAGEAGQVDNLRTARCIVCERKRPHGRLMPCQHKVICRVCLKRAYEDHDIVYCPMCHTEVESVFSTRDYRKWKLKEVLKEEKRREIRAERQAVAQKRRADRAAGIGKPKRKKRRRKNRRASDNIDDTQSTRSRRAWENDDASDVTEVTAFSAFGALGFDAEDEDLEAHDDPFEYEHLGEDFQDTPWVRPTVHRAMQSRKAVMYGGGTASLWRTSSSDLGSIGVGIALYFQFQNFLILLFGILTLLAMPSILFFSYGRRVSEEDIDPLKFVSLALGNLGDPALDCTASSAAACNVTMVEVFGTQMPGHHVSYAITALDCSYSIIFLLAVYLMQRSIREVVRVTDEKNVTPTDYTVFVTGLPEDVTEEEVMVFFNDLYRLDVIDWKGREPANIRTVGYMGKEGELVPGVRKTVHVVRSVQNTGNPMYRNSWVADVSLAHPNGNLIRKFRAVQGTTRRIVSARATVKKYKEDTPFRGGPDSKRQLKAERQVYSMGFQLDKVRQGIGSDLIEKSKIVNAAFVTFNHVESYERCVEDYAHSRSYLARTFLQPRMLQLKSHRLLVTAAVEPSDIIWENMEVSKLTQYKRRLFTAAVTAFLLLISLTLILQAQSRKADFAGTTPQLSMCDSEVPALFHGDYYNVTDAVIATLNVTATTNATANANATATAGGDGTNGTASGAGSRVVVLSEAYRSAHLLSFPPLTRAQLFERPLEDAVCGNVGKSFYVAYRGSGVQYSRRACKDGPLNNGSSCPNPALSRQCPCVDNVNTELCPTLPCLRQELVSATHKCQRFTISTLAGCYCWGELKRAVAAKGMINGAAHVLRMERDMCREFMVNYVLAQTISLAAVLTVVVINSILKVLLTKLVQVEHHNSAGSVASAVTFKIFVAQFINTGVIVLISNARLPDGKQFPIRGLGLFEGAYDDFTSKWYANVGSSIMITMLLQVAAPHAGPLFKMIVMSRLRRRLRVRGDHANNQEELNRLYVGPQFEIATRMPFILNTLFISIMYSGGLPLLIPMAFVSFTVSHWVDKYMLLRYYSRPPAFDESLVVFAVNVMPLALFLHLCLSMWMYGNSELLPSGTLDPSIMGGQVGMTPAEVQQLYQRWLTQMRQYDSFGVTPRIIRANVFPVFLLLVLLLAGTLLNRTLGSFLRATILRLLAGALSLLQRVTRQHVQAAMKVKVEENVIATGTPAFTEDFVQELDPKRSHKLSQGEVEQGWELSAAEGGSESHPNHLVKRWIDPADPPRMRTGPSRGTLFSRGAKGASPIKRMFSPVGGTRRRSILPFFGGPDSAEEEGGEEQEGAAAGEGGNSASPKGQGEVKGVGKSKSGNIAKRGGAVPVNTGKAKGRGKGKARNLPGLTLETGAEGGQDTARPIAEDERPSTAFAKWFQPRTSKGSQVDGGQKQRGPGKRGGRRGSDSTPGETADTGEADHDQPSRCPAPIRKLVGAAQCVRVTLCGEQDSSDSDGSDDSDATSGTGITGGTSEKATAVALAEKNKDKIGLCKKTWEVIRDDGLYSYRILANPAYKDAMMAALHSLQHHAGGGSHSGSGSEDRDSGFPSDYDDDTHSSSD